MDTIKNYGLNELAAFVAVVDAGSFSGAAKGLGVNKAAVSKQIARLETSLNARLLNRSTRRLSVTEIGQEVYWHATRIAEETQIIESTIAGRQLKPAGVLRVSTSTVFGNLHIAGMLPEFMARYPEVRVVLNLNDNYVDIAEERLDVVLRLTSELNLLSVVARRLAELRYVLAASPEYLRRHGCPDSLEALKAHRCMTLRPGGNAERWTFMHAGKEVSIKVNSVLAINSSESLRACVLNGGGIAVLPTYTIGPDIKAGKAVSLLPDSPPTGVFGTHLYAVYLENRFLTPKVRVFIDFLMEKIGEKPYWDDF